MRLICVLIKYENYELLFDLSIYLNGENTSFEFYVIRVTCVMTIFEEDSSEFYLVPAAN